MIHKAESEIYKPHKNTIDSLQLKHKFSELAHAHNFTINFNKGNTYQVAIFMSVITELIQLN